MQSEKSLQDEELKKLLVASLSTKKKNKKKKKARRKKFAAGRCSVCEVPFTFCLQVKADGKKEEDED